MKMSLLKIVVSAVLLIGSLSQLSAQDIMVQNTTCKTMELVAYYYFRPLNSICSIHAVSGAFIAPNASALLSQPTAYHRLIYVEATEQNGTGSSKWYEPMSICGSNTTGVYSTLPTNCAGLTNYELVGPPQWLAFLPMQVVSF